MRERENLVLPRVFAGVETYVKPTGTLRADMGHE